MDTRMSVLLKLAILCVLGCYSLPFQAQANNALLLFGGTDHTAFLGCLNCANTSTVSVCNEFGKYGSEYQSDSIWNQYGKFGSEYSGESPWNKYTNNAPIIVDKNGNSYGYFSVNEYHKNRTRIGWLIAILNYYDKTNDIDKTRKFMCGE